MFMTREHNSRHLVSLVVPLLITVAAAAVYLVCVARLLSCLWYSVCCVLALTAYTYLTIFDILRYMMEMLFLCIC